MPNKHRFVAIILSCNWILGRMIQGDHHYFVFDRNCSHFHRHSRPHSLPKLEGSMPRKSSTVQPITCPRWDRTRMRNWSPDVMRMAKSTSWRWRPRDLPGLLRSAGVVVHASLNVRISSRSSWITTFSNVSSCFVFSSTPLVWALSSTNRYVPGILIRHVSLWTKNDGGTS